LAWRQATGLAYSFPVRDALNENKPDFKMTHYRNLGRVSF
jgi:hypothetical protein